MLTKFENKNKEKSGIIKFEKDIRFPSSLNLNRSYNYCVYLHLLRPGIEWHLIRVKQLFQKPKL